MKKIARLIAALEPLHLLKHPFYQDWMMGKLTKKQLQNYACQYYKHVEAFPRYVSAIHSKCLNPLGRRMLLDNLNDEEGAHGTPHPELWLQFAKGMGASRTQATDGQKGPAISNVVSTFENLTQKSYQHGLGALYAYESQVPEIAESKIRGLIENYGIRDEETLAFFDVHRTADVYHRNVIAELIEALPEEQFGEAQRSAVQSAQSLWDFLTEVHAA